VCCGGELSVLYVCVRVGGMECKACCVCVCVCVCAHTIRARGSCGRAAATQHLSCEIHERAASLLMSNLHKGCVTTHGQFQ